MTGLATAQARLGATVRCSCRRGHAPVPPDRQTRRATPPARRTRSFPAERPAPPGPSVRACHSVWAACSGRGASARRHPGPPHVATSVPCAALATPAALPLASSCNLRPPRSSRPRLHEAGGAEFHPWRSAQRRRHLAHRSLAVSRTTRAPGARSRQTDEGSRRAWLSRATSCPRE